MNALSALTENAGHGLMRMNHHDGPNGIRPMRIGRASTILRRNGVVPIFLSSLYIGGEKERLTTKGCAA
jgi:hypothetical protein